MGKSRKLAAASKPSVEKRVPEIWNWVVLAIIVIVIMAIRFRFLAIPLERDEGEYAYSGQLILHGIPPYKLAYNMKLPGIYYAYALVMAIFGTSVVGIHVGLMLVNAASMVLLYLIGKRLFDSTVGLVAAAAYGVLTIDQSILGTQAHATHFVVLPALGGILLLLKGAESKKLLQTALGGLLLGLAFTMKQQGVFLVTFGLGFVIWDELKSRPVKVGGLLKRTGLFVGPSVAPYLLICAFLAASGVFKTFWTWTVQYARQYVSELTPKQGLDMFATTTQTLFTSNMGLWIFAGIGLILLWVDPESRKKAKFTTGFFIFAFLTIVPGYWFRQHYFVTWMPALALLAGVAVAASRNLIKRFVSRHVGWVPGAIFIVVILGAVNAHADFLFHMPLPEASRSMYGGNPWIETQIIAGELKSRSQPTDTIAVMGSEPQLYFYADRRSATGFIYTYSLMESQSLAHDWQLKMISEIEANKPKFIVIVGISTSWLVRPNSDRTILEWQQKYTADNYRLIGVVTPVPIGPEYYNYETESKWDGQLQGYMPDQNLQHLFVFERK